MILHRKAARLEQLNKEHGTRVLVSGSTVEQLTGSYPLRSMGALEVRGGAPRGRAGPRLRHANALRKRRHERGAGDERGQQRHRDGLGPRGTGPS